MIWMVDKVLFGTNQWFADGHGILHKAIRYAKPIVIRELIKLGYDLEH